MQWQIPKCSRATWLTGLALVIVMAIISNLFGTWNAHLQEFMYRDGAFSKARRSAPLHTQLSPVPKIIWQTSKSHHPAALALRAAYSWSEKNPFWDRYVLDDAEMDAFVAHWHNASVLASFRALPLGVMRADVFRYLVVYQHGGVYSDIDTHCNLPIDEWARPECEVIVGFENDVHMSQWTIAGAPRHPLFARAVDLVLSRISQPIDTSYPHFVHKVTGPGVWTEAVVDFLQLDMPTLLREREALARDRRVCLLSRDELNERVLHYFGSTHARFEKEGDWSSWLREADHAVSQAQAQAGKREGA